MQDILSQDGKYTLYKENQKLKEAIDKSKLTGDFVNSLSDKQNK